MSKCPECKGKGEVIIRDLHKWDYYTCSCGGSGLLVDYENYLKNKPAPTKLMDHLEIRDGRWKLKIVKK